MNQNIYRRGDLPPYRRQRQVCSHQRHGFKPGKHIPRTIPMSCGKAKMSGVERLQHIQAFFSTDLPNDQVIGAHSQGCPDQITDLDCTFALCIRSPGLQAHQIWHLGNLQLCRVLNRNDPLCLGNIR